MKYCYLALIVVIFFAACNRKSKLESEDANETTTYISNDTIPEVRKEVSTKPVASYFVPVGDPRLKWKFGVSVFETPETFHYLLRMQYESMTVTDTLKLPNFGSWPVVQVKKGKDKLSCNIGFLNKKQQFMDYKLLMVENDQLKLKVLKRYFVGVYRDVKE